MSEPSSLWLGKTPILHNLQAKHIQSWNPHHQFEGERAFLFSNSSGEEQIFAETFILSELYLHAESFLEKKSYFVWTSLLQNLITSKFNRSDFRGGRLERNLSLQNPISLKKRFLQDFSWLDPIFNWNLEEIETKSISRFSPEIDFLNVYLNIGKELFFNFCYNANEEEKFLLDIYFQNGSLRFNLLQNTLQFLLPLKFNHSQHPSLHTYTHSMDIQQALDSCFANPLGIDYNQTIKKLGDHGFEF